MVVLQILNMETATLSLSRLPSEEPAKTSDAFSWVEESKEPNEQSHLPGYPTDSEPQL
jgi:hypothetical protein